MKRTVIGSALTLALLISLGPGGPQPAEAGSFRIGSSFRIGGGFFSLAFGSQHRHHRPQHYYRTSHRLSYSGYKCGAYCFKDAGYNYHHTSCRLAQHHFQRYDFNPSRAWGLGYRGDYGRGHYGQRDYGHRDYGYPGTGHRDYGGHDSYRDSHKNHDPRYCPYR